MGIGRRSRSCSRNAVPAACSRRGDEADSSSWVQPRQGRHRCRTPAHQTILSSVGAAWFRDAAPTALRPKLSDPAPGTREWQPERDGRVSWCRTTSSDTNESGDTDRQTSRAKLWPEPLARGEGKRFERVKGRGRWRRRTRAAGWGFHRWRATNASLKNTRRQPHALLTTFIGAAAHG